MALCDRANATNEIVRPHVFEDVAMCPTLHRSHDRGILGVACQDQDPELWRDGQEPLAGFGVRGVRKLQIEQHHVRVEALDQRHGLCDRPGFSDD
jgi:hypothetical protein